MERHLELAEIYELPAAPGEDGGAEGMQRVIAAFSRLASAMASTDAKNPRWASPTFVHTRTSGSATRTSVLISPG